MNKIVYTVKNGNCKSKKNVELCDIEIRILYYIIKGQFRKEMPDLVHLTEDALKKHLRNLYRKTEILNHDFRGLLLWIKDYQLEEFIISYVEELIALKAGSVKKAS